MPKASTKLADPDGTEEIVRSEATTRYKVKPIDLDTLLPVRTERGDKNVVVKYYNTGEVEALEQRLKQAKVPKRTVTKTGGKISAETDFGDSVQASTSAPPLPGTSKGKKKEDSNEPPSRAKNKGKSPAKQNDDVVSKSGKTVPSSSKPKKSPVKKNYDYDEYEEDLMEDGMFDGMDSDDAAALCEYFILLKCMF
ncbi:hypothetical protein ARMGADRAFT_1090277 [Armillaria gallica]|uniref:Uncharacterized protein n=1 Tax=Armillaria gallica TaxID=47427 RepID=A0A2H3CTQ8_ARMGA|nr:hypothetical protein ARMGADRAFT_1090277 [Armillaria gallica]